MHRIEVESEKKAKKITKIIQLTIKRQISQNKLQKVGFYDKINVSKPL